MNVTVACTEEAINMKPAKQVSEADILEALMFGHEEIKRLARSKSSSGDKKNEVELSKFRMKSLRR